MQDAITIKVSGEAQVYQAYGDDGKTDMGGLDLSGFVEYALFPIVDVGVVVDHIPLVPAKLTHKQTMTFNKTIVDGKTGFDLTGEGAVDTDIDPDTTNISGVEQYVMRPISFDFYALYRPFRNDFVTVKPNLGFTANNPSEKTYFNLGIAGQLNIARILFVTLASGNKDGIWQHSLDLGVNLRVFELDLGIGLAGQNYLQSWSSGVVLGFGFKAGF
jgi:hypothetical protein